MNRVFNLLILLALLYLLFEKFGKDNQESEQVIVLKDQGQNVEVTKLGFFANFFANTLVKIAESDKGQELVLKLVGIQDRGIEGSSPSQQVNNPSYINKIFNIKSINEVDTNPAAYCGADVVVSYKIFNDSQIITEENQKQIHLGDFGIPALENAIVGMKEQESRSAMIFYPHAGDFKDYMLSNEEKIKGLNIQVTLNKVLSQNIEGVRIFDDIANMNKPIICGEKISSQVKVTDFQGKTILQEKISYKVGHSKYPAIFSYALFNKPSSSTRSVIAKAKYLKSNNTKIAKEIKTDDNLVLIEFAKSD
jgi:hypothetical protein